MEPESSFDQLMQQLALGDNEAANQIVTRFLNRLVAYATRELGPNLRRKVGPSDVAQSVFRLFFTRQKNDPYAIDSWENLWALLVGITLGKCRGLRAHYHRQRRDISQEVTQTVNDNGERLGWEALDREPTPEECAIVKETWELALGKLDERSRQVAGLRLQGYTPSEISEFTGCSERTVFRVLNVVREHLESQIAGEDDG